MKTSQLIMLYAIALIILVIAEQQLSLRDEYIISLILSACLLWLVIRDHTHLKLWQKALVGISFYIIANFFIMWLLNMMIILSELLCAKLTNSTAWYFLGLLPVLIFLHKFTFEIKRKAD